MAIICAAAESPANSAVRASVVPTLSACLIARNELNNVRPCLGSFWAHVDEVVLVDTGSKDGTVSEARRYASEQPDPGKLVIGRFPWCDDFAAARNHAHQLARGTIHLTMDLDERLIGGERLQDVARTFDNSPTLRSILAPHVQAIHGVPANVPPVDACNAWLTRLYRAPVHWINPTWEEVDPAPMPAAPTDKISSWHGRTRPRGRRDLDIALKWLETEPGNLRALEAVSKEAAGNDDYELAFSACETALAQHRLPAITQQHFRAQMANSLLALRRFEEAERHARTATRGKHTFDWVTGWQVRAHCALVKRNYEEAERAALKVLKYRHGHLNLISAPAEQRCWAAVIAALSAAALGKFSAACNAAEEALRLMPPGHPFYDTLPPQYALWERRTMRCVTRGLRFPAFPAAPTRARGRG